MTQKENTRRGFARTNKNCHPEFISGSTPLIVTQYKEEMLGSRIKALRDMASGNAAVQHDNRVGFTLIELLVVVLIIGILAAVAVPQYQIAVEKSKTTQGWALVKSLAQAQEAYKIMSGSYTRDWEKLDIAVPLQASSACDLNTQWSSSMRGTVNGDWVIVLDRQKAIFAPVMAVRRTGRFKCYALYVQNGKPYCAESTDPNGLHTGNFCKKLSGNSHVIQEGDWKIYDL